MITRFKFFQKPTKGKINIEDFSNYVAYTSQSFIITHDPSINNEQIYLNDDNSNDFNETLIEE